ncbi:MAG TPA: serine hydrolase domain-containing protein [Chitinophagales bacterium]|nr:serine hydrolase domain-containing protein [Chitinophagales bacterium]
MVFVKNMLRFVLVAGLLYLPLGHAFAAGPDDDTETECTDETLLPGYACQMTADQIEAYYTHRHKADGFNGTVLVAKDGEPIYTGAFGYGNYTEKDTLTTETAFQLASITKTFTSAAVLQLVEQGKISLDDSVQKYLPEFPYQGITIRLLLCHRTGLPDYIYWTQDFIGKDVAYLTNQSMYDLLVAKKPQLRCPPNHLFLYSNTNYALLALIIEKASGLSYKQYLTQNIFMPLGMTNTFVCTVEDTASHCGAVCYEARRWKEWKTAFSDGVLGDKGIYSSVEDMLKWDNALKEGKVLSEDMLKEAYTPQSHDRYSFARDRSHNYGLGWRLIKQHDGNYFVYHNGNWHGCNNVFARNLEDGYTLIVLGNKENAINYLTQPVWDIIARAKNLENVAVSGEE